MKNLIVEPTGGNLKNYNYKSINYKLGEYNIVVKLNEKNEFIGIENLSVDKIFYSHNSVKSEQDVAKYYEE